MIALGTPRELIATLGGEQVIEFAVDETLEPTTLQALPGVKAVRTVPATHNAWALTVDEVHVAIPALLDHLETLYAADARLSTNSRNAGSEVVASWR